MTKRKAPEAVGDDAEAVAGKPAKKRVKQKAALEQDAEPKSEPAAQTGEEQARDRVQREARALLDIERADLAERENQHPTFEKILGSGGGREVVLGMAQRFLCDEDVCPTLVYYQGIPYAYDKEVWGRLAEDDVLTIISSMLYQCSMRLPPAGDERPATVVPYPTNQAVVGEVAFQLPRILSIQSTYDAPCRWIANPAGEARTSGWIGRWEPIDARGKASFRGLILDMMTGEAWSNRYVFIPNGPTWEYSAEAKKPERWLRFLASLKLDAESILLLQEWFGYALSPDTWAHKGLIVIGPPRAGKGIIGHILSELVGQLMVSSPALHKLGKEFGLESLLNKRLCLISDGRLSNRVDTAAVIETLLRLVAADYVSVGRKFLSDLNVVLAARVMILSNEMPQLGDNSKAINTRFLILELTETFLDREDTGLKDDLMEELPGIALWAIDGYRRLRTRGAFLEPASSKKARDDWYEENNPVAQFVADRCKVEVGMYVGIDSLNKAYEEWALDKRMPEMNSSSFSRRLVSTVGEKKLSRDKVGGVRFMVGIRLLKADELKEIELKEAIEQHRAPF
jgi:putative DNA primase/helicase